MQKGAASLLKKTGAKGGHGGVRGALGDGGLLAADRRTLGGRGTGGGRGLELGEVLPDEVAVELLDGAAEDFEDDGEEEDADAGAGEHGVRGDAPAVREEAGVDGI